MLETSFLLGMLALSNPDATTSGSASHHAPTSFDVAEASAPARGSPPTAAAGPRRSRAGRDAKPPWSWTFVGAHWGTGAVASLVVLPASYAFADWVGHRGKGLGPVVGALLVGAFLPPIVTYSTQWAVGRSIAGRRERYWPGLLVHQLGHLAVFTGAVLGGANFRDIRDAAPVVLVDALLVTGLGSITAEATRRPAPAELSWQRAQRLFAPPRLELVVPVMEVRF